MKQTRFNFAGRTVVITGGSRGLGLVLARQFAREGARLALMARHKNDLERAQRELARLTDVGIYACDVRRRAEVDATVHDIAYDFGRIDVLVNNAGVIQGGPSPTLPSRTSMTRWRCISGDRSSWSARRCRTWRNRHGSSTSPQSAAR